MTTTRLESVPPAWLEALDLAQLAQRALASPRLRRIGSPFLADFLAGLPPRSADITRLRSAIAQQLSKRERFHRDSAGATEPAASD